MTETSAPGRARLDAVRWVELPSHGDDRGVLTAIESGIDIPFEIRRVYLLHHLEGDRGGHAHRDTHQIVIAGAGHALLVLSDGTGTRSFHLDHPTRGVYLGPMLWIRVEDISPGAVVVVLASTHYDKKRSIRTWDDYLAAIGER